MRAAGLAAASPATAKRVCLAPNNGGSRDVIPDALARGLNKDEDCTDDPNNARDVSENDFAEEFAEQHLLHGGWRTRLKIYDIKSEHLLCW